MGKTRIKLDADGFSRTQEEGGTWRFGAELLFNKFGGHGSYISIPGATSPTAFWNPGGSRYLLPVPRQFSPTFYRDSRLGDHVVTSDLWTFSAGLTPRDWNPSHRWNAGIFGTEYPLDEWMYFYVDAGTPALLSCDFVQMGKQVKVDCPATMKIVATADLSPVGAALGTGAMKHALPFVQVAQYPAPTDLFAFGFSNLCLLFAGSKIYLLRSPSGEKDDWELVPGGTLDRIAYHDAKGQPIGIGISWDTASLRSLVAGVMVVELGDSSLYLINSDGQGKEVRLRPSPGIGEEPEEFLPDGGWWIGVPEGQKVQCQIQVMGFEEVDTAGLDPEFIRFDSGNEPTQAPTTMPLFIMHANSLADITSEEVITGTKITSATTGEHFTYQLRDAAGGAWVSDGTAAVATLYLNLTPATPGGLPGGYLTPQLVEVVVSFPSVVVPRVSDEQILTDRQYDGWEVEASLDNPEDARFTVDLRETDLLLLEDMNFDERITFPVILEEDLGGGGPGDPEAWAPRAQGWVQSLELLAEEKFPKGLETGHRRFQIRARGLLSRALRKWIGTPSVLDATQGGKTSHLFAVKTTLHQSHFDVDDPDRVRLATDPGEDTDAFWLPATPDSPEGQLDGADKKQPWGPAWDELMLHYLKRIAGQWSGWHLYARLTGLVWYHPDLLVETADAAAAYWPRATLYATIEGALAAGMPKAQVYTLTGRQTILPKGNVVKIQGKALVTENGKSTLEPRRRVERDAAAITDIDYENFAGEEIVDSAILKLAVGETALRQLARIRLRRVRRKRIVRQFTLDMAAWDIEGPVLDFGAGPEQELGLDVGDCFTAEHRGDYLITHIRVKETHRDVRQTVITAERLPAGAAAGDVAGEYPGQGLLVERA